MVIKIALFEDDYLTYQLYTASKNKRTKNKRTQSWLIITGAFSIFAVFFKQNNNLFLTYYFVILAVLSLCFYPFYQRYYYKRQYKKYVLDNNANSFGKEVIIDIDADYLQTKSIGSEGKISTSGIAQLNEIGSHYFIKLNSGSSLIIPKKMVDEQLFLAELNEIAQKNNIPLNHELNWKWK